MAAQIGQEITPLPAAPVEGAGFRVRAAAFLSALVTLALELVTWTTQVNAVAVAVNADAVAAALAAGEAGTAAEVADAASGTAATAASAALAAAAEAARWAAGAAPMLSGAGAPAAETGADGQYYLDTASGNLYKRTAGAWGVVASLMGPSGSGVPVGGTAGQTLVKLSDADNDTGWGSPASGASKWTALAAGTDYAATPASTSTLHMTTDQTAAIKPGLALRYVIGGVAYYGVVTAVTSGLLTVAGAPLSGDVTALDYSIFPGMVETMTLSDPGAWADSADTALVANDLLMALVWPGPPAALVRIQAWTRTTDTGTNKPRINARLGETPTDSVSTDKSNAGLELVASSTWTATGVDIDPAKYAVSLGTAIELRTDANGSNDDARDLTVVLTFVYA